MLPPWVENKGRQNPIKGKLSPPVGLMVEFYLVCLILLSLMAQARNLAGSTINQKNSLAIGLSRY
jgi:hypothetical protein